MAQKALSRSGSPSVTSPLSSRELAFVQTLFGAARAARIADSDRGALVERVRQLIGSQPSRRRDVLVRWYGLDGEGATGNVRATASRLDMSERDVEVAHARATSDLRNALCREFPALAADPRPTPRTH